MHCGALCGWDIHDRYVVEVYEYFLTAGFLETYFQDWA